jgi:hypothetical protein
MPRTTRLTVSCCRRGFIRSCRRSRACRLCSHTHTCLCTGVRLAPTLLCCADRCDAVRYRAVRLPMLQCRRAHARAIASGRVRACGLVGVGVGVVRVVVFVFVVRAGGNAVLVGSQEAADHFGTAHRPKLHPHTDQPMCEYTLLIHVSSASRPLSLPPPIQFIHSCACCIACVACWRSFCCAPCLLCCGLLVACCIGSVVDCRFCTILPRFACCPVP